MAKMQDQVKVVLPKHKPSENDIDLPWLLLCSKKNSRRRIFCFGVTENDLSLLKNLLNSFTTVSSCTFENSTNASGKFPTNINIKHLDKNIPVLPYDSNLFDVAVICNFPLSKRSIPGFFSEIHRVLRPDGSLFFCFSNSLSCQRVNQLLRFSGKIEEQEEGGVSFPLSVLSCRNSLAKSGFSLPCFYTFSPGCNKLFEIRDCSKRSQLSFLCRPYVSLKALLVHFLKNTRFVRNYLATHYGVVAGKEEGVSVRALPALIADEMGYKFQGTSWQVWGDIFDVTGKGTFVFKLYDSNARKTAICKIPLNRATQKHLEANYSALANINANLGIPAEVKEKIPSVIVRSEINGYLYFVEELKEGVPAIRYRHVKRAYDDILYSSSKSITAIHNCTLYESKSIYKSLITSKIKLLSNVITSENDFIIELEAFLHDSLESHSLFVTSKGDCSANNIIVNLREDVSGIIDWDQSQEVSFPLVDIINLIESFRRNFENKSMGQLIIELFFDEKISALEHTILTEYCTCLSLSVKNFIPFAVLYWIDHIIAQDFVAVCKDKRWMENNVISVVNYLKNYI